MGFKGRIMKNNKGFSLVELIIVIAIMAILAGAIAPALIRYIDKSRKSNDVSAAKTIKTAVETAMSSEAACTVLTTGTEGSLTDLDGNTVNYCAVIEVLLDQPTGGNGNGVVITPASGAIGTQTDIDDAATEIGKNIGEKTPRLKFRKAANGTDTPTSFYVYCSQGASVTVGVGDGTKFYQLAPEVSKYY